MRRDQLPMHVNPTFVLPQYKAVYVAVAKAACTSLKWLVADVMGESAERITASPSRAVTPDMCIHHRSRWRRTPTLHRLSDKELAAIDPDRGWFVFTVVRHPAARLFSAWQSKFLLREPSWVDKVGDRPWFPRVPTSQADVIADFDRFARTIRRWPAGRVMRDRHFMPQWTEAAIEKLPYTKVYDTAEIPRLLDDLGRHLAAHGHDGALRLRRSNETPLAPITELFTDDVRAALQDVYAEDYEHLGYDELLPPKRHPGDAWPGAVIDEVGRIVERHARIGELHRQLVAERERERAAA